MTFPIRPCFETALKRLDLLLHREILRLRARYQLSQDEFRGLYISDSQIDRLIQEKTQDQALEKGIAELTAEAEQLAQISRRQLSRDAAWARLTGEFRLGLLDHDMLLLAMAPELHPRYETLYAYLNDDITRKYPTVNLALRLFGDKDGPAARAVLSRSGRLFREHLLKWYEEGAAPAALNAGFAVATAVRGHLLALPPAESDLLHRSQFQPCPVPAWDQLVCHATLHRRLQGLARQIAQQGDMPTIVLEGEIGSGRWQAARTVLGGGGKNIIRADLALLKTHRKTLLAQLQRLVTQARLTEAGLYLTGLDSLMDADPAQRQDLKTALPYLAGAPLIRFYAIAPHRPWRTWLSKVNPLALSFPDPAADQRELLWRQALERHELHSGKRDVAAAAERFALNTGQIDAAAASLNQQRRLAHQRPGKISRDRLFAAARDQSAGEIGRLAQKVKLLYGWEDLVLPRTTLQHLKEIVDAICHRPLVYDQWDMQRRMGGMRGLMILFAGASGTGKSMSAGVIAAAIGLDVYRIDLAGVVSKYIGETEKNLDRIFTAARRANGILFFDEADALFGKRTEIKDAHDRYANIEVAYLLQKMEEHDGVVILATNIAKNLDPAFSRRLHYTVEFPRPDAGQRERLWRGMFSEKTPLADDVDFSFLARQFDTTGGEIKTTALDAAMLAAGNGRVVTMALLVKAMARQIIKQGQVPSVSGFKQYYRLLKEG